MAELDAKPNELEDPLAEEAYMPVPGLTHRYPDRALLYVTHNCPVYCRYCLRKRKVSDPRSATGRDELDDAIEYIRQTPAIRDVLVSGGDPLTFSDERLSTLLGSLRAISHVDIIRLATRNPVTLPQRIDQALAAMLRRFHPIYVSTHFNHLRECTPEAATALLALADAGCVISNQMVLLKGVNDKPDMVQQMNRWLLRHRARPYYIFQCDMARGISHFRTPIQTGINMVDALRGWTSGLAVPHYVVDLPGGGGKVALEPKYLLETQGKNHRFRNYRGEVYSYEDP